MRSSSERTAKPKQPAFGCRSVPDADAAGGPSVPISKDADGRYLGLVRLALLCEVELP